MKLTYTSQHNLLSTMDWQTLKEQFSTMVYYTVMGGTNDTISASTSLVWASLHDEMMGIGIPKE